MITDKQKEKEQGVLSRAYKVYRSDLSRYASHKLKNYSKVEDLVQETFLKTWKYVIRGKKIIAMKAFLYHVLNDLIIDEYRKHKTVSLENISKNNFEPSFDEREHLINVFDGKIALFFIKKLPKKYQKIIYMRYIQDLSLEEISTITKQSKNSIAVQIHRGLRKLKSLFINFKK